MNSESLEEILYSIKNSKLSLILASQKICVDLSSSKEPRVKNLIRNIS